jgi:hypothetical protein
MTPGNGGPIKSIRIPGKKTGRKKTKGRLPAKYLLGLGKGIPDSIPGAAKRVRSVIPLHLNPRNQNDSGRIIKRRRALRFIPGHVRKSPIFLRPKFLQII